MRSAKCGWPICCTRASRSQTDVDRPAMLRMAFQTGRLSVTNKDDGGALAAGEPADILVLDWDAVDAERLRADLDPCDLLFARTTMRHIHELIVGGPHGRSRWPGSRRRLSGDARRAAGAPARRHGAERHRSRRPCANSSAPSRPTINRDAPCC